MSPQRIWQLLHEQAWFQALPAQIRDSPLLFSIVVAALAVAVILLIRTLLRRRSTGDVDRRDAIRSEIRDSMVAEGSVSREPDSLTVRFTLTNYAGAEVDVTYTGILPDLFREGQGILVRGQLIEDRLFEAQEVLAKHDENYMPPELLDMAGAPQP